MHGASSGGSTPDLTSLELTAAAVDDVSSVSEKFYQQAAAGRSRDEGCGQCSRMRILRFCWIFLTIYIFFEMTCQKVIKSR